LEAELILTFERTFAAKIERPKENNR